MRLRPPLLELDDACHLAATVYGSTAPVVSCAASYPCGEYMGGVQLGSDVLPHNTVVIRTTSHGKTCCAAAAVADCSCWGNIGVRKTNPLHPERFVTCSSQPSSP